MASVHSILCFFLLLSAAASAAKIATHIHFYLHDSVVGPNPSAVRVVTGPNSTGFSFGDVFVLDDPMTEGPDLASRLVGRAQGFYAFASKGAAPPGVNVLLLTVNLVFIGGAHNGSTLAVLSRDPIGDEVTELPVVGGTGAFRMARGYVMMKTYSFTTSGVGRVCGGVITCAGFFTAQI